MCVTDPDKMALDGGGEGGEGGVLNPDKPFTLYRYIFQDSKSSHFLSFLDLVKEMFLQDLSVDYYCIDQFISLPPLTTDNSILYNGRFFYYPFVCITRFRFKHPLSP